MNKKIVEIKKNLLAKKIKSYQAISELRDLVSDNAVSDKLNNNLVVEKLDGVSTAIKSIKTPDFLPVIKTIQNIKPIELKEVISLLKEILNREIIQINQQEPIKWPKNPKDAIPVVLTDKTKGDFYNAISSLPIFGGSGIDTSLISSKELQQQTIDAINNLEINADSPAQKITVSGSYTYIGIAAPGTAQATAKWRCKRIDESVSGTTIFTWADGDALFDNISTDLTALTYS